MPEIIEQIIRYEAETGDAEKKLKKLKGTQSDLVKAFAELKRDKSLDELRDNALAAARQTGDLVDAAKQLGRELRAVGATEDEISRVTKEFSQMAAQAEKAAQAARGIAPAKGNFDTVSENVSLAGDAESSIRAISGAIGTLGGEVGAQIEQLTNVGAEFLAVTEAAPRLVASLSGLPQTISAAASALGPAGLLVAGVAAGAAALVALYKNSIKEQEKALQAFAQASAEFVDFVAGGGTTKEAVASQEENLRRIEIIEKEKLRLETEYAERRFNILDRFLNDGEEALANQVKEFDNEIRDLTAANDRYQEAIEDNELATNDAASAQEEASKEIKSASQAFDSATSKYKSSASSQKSAMESASSALDNLGNTATSAASRFDSAASSFNSARPARQLSGDASGETLGLNDSYTFSFGTRKRRKSSSSSPSTSTAAKDQDNAYQDYLERQRQFQKDQQSALLDHERAVEDIRRDARDSREDSVRQRDFAGAAQSIRDEDRAIRDQKINTQRRLDDLATAQQQELSIHRAGQAAILNQTQSFFNQLSGQFQQGFQTIQSKNLEYVLG